MDFDRGCKFVGEKRISDISSNPNFLSFIKDMGKRWNVSGLEKFYKGKNILIETCDYGRPRLRYIPKDKKISVDSGFLDRKSRAYLEAELIHELTHHIESEAGSLIKKFSKEELNSFRNIAEVRAKSEEFKYRTDVLKQTPKDIIQEKVGHYAEGSQKEGLKRCIRSIISQTPIGIRRYSRSQIRKKQYC